MNYCYLNGQIIPENEANVSILDIGLLRGFGIYEAMAVLNGGVFRWEDHIARFKKSADFLRIHIPLNDDTLKRTIFALIEKNGLSQNRVNVKCILTGGHAIGGIDFNSSKPTFYIFTEEWRALDTRYQRDGASVIVHEHLRQYPEYKTTNYITATHLQKDLKDAGALEILYTWKNDVLECATSNFFIVKNGTLVTATENILAGVTRNVVIELAKKNGLTVDERAYTLDELFSADECFLTSSFKDVVPVVKVGDKTIADGLVGETTKKIARAFDGYLQTYE
jgi:D-amino acid aminotransferase